MIRWHIEDMLCPFLMVSSSNISISGRVTNVTTRLLRAFSGFEGGLPNRGCRWFSVLPLMLSEILVDALSKPAYQLEI